ncbi:MAG TPA: 16S rRNA (guanine(966)-N(2))-methyltransferase RsmD [Gemmatimonadaceae bacterium]|nr:16S rRNA (guanine(966)-N(2))-methyltransferase RsmD [Gemmatimonadaceae bacterium]
MPELRIVAGQWRGRRIQVPPSGVRPTADRVREAWMSILQRDIPDARVLDLCAGSGALGLECLSRGAVHCDFVEQSPAVAKVLKANVQVLGAGSLAAVHVADAVEFVERLVDGRRMTDAEGVASSLFRPYSLALADPPYASSVAEQLASLWLRAPFSDIFGIEHAASQALPEPVAGASIDRRRYGDSAITIYRATP